MDQQLEEIRDQQKDTWNKFSGGWKKNNDLTMDWLKPMGTEIIRLLKLKENDVVLDVASGTGEPGLTISTIVKKGKVIATDLSEEMLVLAKEHAKQKGLANFETVVCDVCELPFEDNSFDAISCRFGFMFFPDMQLAANEMARVLKPGGRVATSVWSVPEQNFWITAIMSSINKNMEIAPPPPGAPGMFRCAQKGLIADIFKKAGLKNITETDISGKLNTQTADGYWNFMNQVAAPVVGALSKADDATKARIKREVYEAVNQRYPDGNVAIDSTARVIYGEK